MDHGIVLAPRKPPYTRAAFQAHYEDFHAPLFYRYTAPAIGRYLRNHVVAVFGADPPFDTISEFGIHPEKRGWLGERLRSPETRDLEDDVQSFLAERGNSFPVAEELIAGAPRSPAIGGPVRKRALLLRGAPGDARALATQLGTGTERVTLTLWQHAPAPFDAMIMLWAGKAELPPVGPSIPAALSLAYEVDVDEYCSAWQA